MSSRAPHCSIVIRSYNEERSIGRLLTGILQQTIRDIEIILVDSGSTDATLSIASRYPVHILSIQPEAFTFGRSLNLGCAQASGEFIVIASAHIYPVYPDWLEQLLSPFADPQVALVYGKQRGNETTKFSEHQIFATWFPEQSNFRQDHPFCNNANAAIRRALWQQKTYDEELPALEDLDWATWALAQGYRVAYVTEAEVNHVHDEIPRQVYNRYRREAMALNRIQPQAHFNIWDFLRLYLSNVVIDCWHAWEQRYLRRELGGILWFRWMQFLGTYHGFRYAGLLTSDLKRAFFYPRELRLSERASSRDVDPLDYSKIGEPHAKE